MLFRIFALYLVLNVSRLQCVPLSQVKPLEASESYTHSALADEESPELYKLYWKLIDDDQIQFEIHCKTTGWVGFGLAPSYGMAGADIAIGWVKNGLGFLRDTHAVGFMTPQTDYSQDWLLLDAAEVNGYTMLKIKRKLNTCDKDHDLAIKQETHYLIFAWNEADPATGLNDWIYHGRSRKNKVDLLLIHKDESLTQEELDVQNSIAIDLTLKNHPVKRQQTYYFCQFFEVPVFEQEMHLIRYQIIVDKPNKDIFHHLVIHECPDSTATSLNSIGTVGHECGAASAPSYVNRCLELAAVVAWSVGGQTNFSFPHNTGYPIKKSSTKKYYLFEYHFENPTLDPSRLVNSGVRFYYTSQLREHELGILTLTSGTRPLDLAVPPQVQDFKISPTCYPECLTNFAPPEGFKMFSAFMHSHMAGQAMRTSLIRNNRIVKYLFDNPKYDFNYQFNIQIEPETVYRGDQLTLDCVFKTMDRNFTTFWGYSSDMEMCMSFIYYYPRNPKFDTCRSVNTAQTLINFINKLSSDGLIPSITLNPNNISQAYAIVVDYLKNQIVWTDELRRRYKEFYANPGPQTGYCGSRYFPLDSLTAEKPFSLPFDEVAASITDTCKAN